MMAIIGNQPTVKEHDHHWDSQQDFNQLKNVINFNKSNLTISGTSVTHTRKHACNTCEEFSVGRLPMMPIIGQNM
jgi:hypothetical protein